MTGEPMQSVMLALLMATTGAAIAMAAAMWRAPRPLARWIGVAFDLAVASYALKLWNDHTGLLPPALAILVNTFSFGTVALFWLFVIVLFEDRRTLRPIYFAPLAALVLVSVAAYYGPDVANPALWVASNVIQLALALHALVVIIRGWKGDLVEVRRRLRGPFLVAVTIYILALRGFDIWELIGTAPAWYPMANAAVLSLVCFAGTFVFLESRDELFGAGEALARRPVHAKGAAANAIGNSNGQATAANGLDRAAKADLDRLEALMAREQVWREEGLTIAGLALRAGMPESQLRWLINDRLGHRNFPSYVNGHRIAAAKARLADPNEARISISAIAYDIGFASLGPFNRAFREETGVSPSEWRRKALSEPSPIPVQA